MTDLSAADLLAAPTVPACDESAPIERSSLSGYELGPLIGRGGMGEVIAAQDEDIGRPIAIKRLRGTSCSAAASEQFLREARIQARLEHPAIVPVHELGYDAGGQPYFTMKRIAGLTFAELLTTQPPRQRLLRAFIDVCSAVAFAHEHGVVHRDLKPANIMLGDFQETYVLDWGLARVLAEASPDELGVGLDAVEGPTQPEALVGTPGYMAPEQVRGEPVGTAADIYALGAILFEILTNEPLHPRGPSALASTLGPIERSPAVRNPGRVPPELDLLCVDALAPDPSSRPTAKQLADRVARYLDGDRDLERRQVLAATWLAAAQEALSSDEVGGRADAMQLAGRALALDPESAAAAELVSRLMLEPPPRLPEALQRELAATAAATQRRQSKFALASFAAIAVFLALAGAAGVRSVAVFGAIAAVTAVLVGVQLRLTRRAASTAMMFAVAIGNVLLAALLSRAFGSLILAPAVTCAMAVSLTAYPQLIDHARVVVAMLVTSWSIPVLLERLGILESTWRIDHGEVISRSTLMTLDGSSPVLLVVFSVLTIIVTALFASALARSRREAQRQVEIQAWHLRQLLPGPRAPTDKLRR